MSFEVTIQKASPIGSEPAPPDVIINITGAPLNTDEMELNELGDLYMRDASAICAALVASLSGGTFDRLLGLMLARKASFLIVPYGPSVSGGKDDR